MPGIFGVIPKGSFPRERSAEILGKMLGAIVKEDFTQVGQHVDDASGIGIAWATHKGSFSDCMPMCNEEKDIFLFFIGEDFRPQEEITELRSRGHRFDGSDGSYLVHLYEEKGESFLGDLNGSFNGILLDCREGKAILFNDRYGMRRIYHYDGAEYFCFASKAKAILGLKPDTRRIATTELGQYLAWGSTFGEHSLFSGIGILPGGSRWIFNYKGGNRKERYFHPGEWEDLAPLRRDDFLQELKGTLIQIMPMYRHSREPVGVSLTGGLDTRIIMSYLDMQPGSLPCYTFGGMYRECFDVKVARKVAAVCRQNHQVLTIGEKFLDAFPQFAEKTVRLTDGCADATVSHEIYLNRLAREIAPVRLTGNYGSEVLRSVNYNRPAPPERGVFIEEVDRSVEDACLLGTGLLNGRHQVSCAVFHLIPRLLFGRLLAAQSQITVRTPYMDNKLVRLMFQASEGARETKDMSIRLIAEGNPRLGQIPTDRGFGGHGNVWLSRISRAYREFLFKADYLSNDGMPDNLQRINRFLGPLGIDRIFAGRHKIEHYRIWFQNQLMEYVKEILLDSRSLGRPYLNPGPARKAVSSFLRKENSNLNLINKLLSLELLHRCLLEG